MVEVSVGKHHVADPFALRVVRCHRQTARIDRDAVIYYKTGQVLAAGWTSVVGDSAGQELEFHGRWWFGFIRFNSAGTGLGPAAVNFVGNPGYPRCCIRG